ncbi:MAG TPA: phosphomethylpyrimidine synthase ThiC [Candidatus Omnitrophota bacterium]|nr:phosphomethylpyrimidine synthase ThiC [Candidatus Omnitrophota bacterium]
MKANRAAWVKNRKGIVTQMHYARNRVMTGEMRFAAGREGLNPEFVRSEVARGRMIIPANIRHLSLEPAAIGIAASCKINANLGNSSVTSEIGTELEKMRVAIRAGADAVMDLSTGGDILGIRRAIIQASPVPVGTVPIYEALHRAGSVGKLTADGILEVIESQAREGVDFMTIHAGILSRHIPLARKRLTGIVSRGGAILAQWMLERGEENPLYRNFEKICKIFRQYDVAFSLGDGLRPGCLHDASDRAQFAELKVLGALTRLAWKYEVQVMVEGPGHIPFNQIEMNVRKQRKLCSNAPFYVLGPLVTDIAAGYDHINSAIGGTMAGYAGAAMLCYVTPKEHLGLPDIRDVREGVIAHKIAAHAVDIARGRKGARDRDERMAEARFRFDWEKQFECALDPETARAMHDETLPGESYKEAAYCSMCGPDFCPMSISRKAFGKHCGSRKAGRKAGRRSPAAIGV